MTQLLQYSVLWPSAYVSIRSHLFLHHFLVRQLPDTGLLSLGPSGTDLL